MRIKLAALTIAIVSLLLLPSRAKADTFVYNVTSTHDNVNVTFDEPTFQETVTPTTFTTNTPSLGPVTEFALTANSFCSISSGGFSVMVGAPWFAGIGTSFDFESSGCLDVPPFTGPGTFTATGFSETTMVTMTDVPSVSSGVPEPSSLLLLGCGLFGLLAMASFGSRIRRFAS